MGRAFIPYAATAVALVFFAGGIAAILPVVANVLACTGGAFAIAAIGISIRDWRRNADPYSLKHLRLHYEEETPKSEAEIDAPFDSVFCPCCETVYSNRLPICPNCKGGRCG